MRNLRSISNPLIVFADFHVCMETEAVRLCHGCCPYGESNGEDDESPEKPFYYLLAFSLLLLGVLVTLDFTVLAHSYLILKSFLLLETGRS